MLNPGWPVGGWQFSPPQWLAALVFLVGGSFTLINWINDQLTDLQTNMYQEVIDLRQSRRDLDARLSERIRTVEQNLRDELDAIRRNIPPKHVADRLEEHELVIGGNRDALQATVVPTRKLSHDFVGRRRGMEIHISVAIQ